jgi:hypothetical protein
LQERNAEKPCNNELATAFSRERSRFEGKQNSALTRTTRGLISGRDAQNKKEERVAIKSKI